MAPVSAGTDPTSVTRAPLLNLPDTRASAGASAGAGVSVSAGSTTWPASVAGNVCSDAVVASAAVEDEAASAVKARRRAVRRVDMGQPPFG